MTISSSNTSSSLKIRWYVLVTAILFASGSVSFVQGQVIFGGGDQDYWKWDTFGNADDKFHGRFPKAPAVFLTRRDLKEITGRHTGRIYSSYDEGVACIVVVFDNGKNPPPLAQFIDEVRTRFFRSWDVSFVTDITLNRDDGKHFALKRREMNGEAKFFVKKTHSYMFAAVARGADNVGVKRFIDGFAMWDYELDKAKWPARTEGDAQAATPTAGPGSKPPLKPEEELIPHVRRVDTPKPDAAPGSETSPPKDPAAYYDRIFDQEEVTTKATIVLKPEAIYTEEARNNTIEGSVKVNAVLTRDGKVADVSVVHGLPYGLSESAVKALRSLTFLPAKKDDHYVSQKITIEYVFSLN